jgi:hypothetical protein
MSATLLFENTPLSVSREALVANCAIFTTNPALADSPYTIRSSVDLGSVRSFLGAVEGTAAAVTGKNWAGLWQLSGEFGFGALASDLSTFAGWCQADAESRRRISILEERATAQDRTLGRLEAASRSRSAGAVGAAGDAALSALSAALVRLEAVERELSALKDSVSRLRAGGDSRRGEFSGACDGNVAVVGERGDLERLLALIDWAERFPSDYLFEFIAVDGDRPLPAGTKLALICGPAEGRSSAIEVPSVRIGFAGGCRAEAEVTVDVRTGAGIGLALAALQSRREGGKKFEFVDGGRTRASGGGRARAFASERFGLLAGGGRTLTAQRIQ